MARLPPGVPLKSSAAEVHALRVMQLMLSDKSQHEQLKQASRSLNLADVPGVIGDLWSDCFVVVLCATFMLYMRVKHSHASGMSHPLMKLLAAAGAVQALVFHVLHSTPLGYVPAAMQAAFSQSSSSNAASLRPAAHPGATCTALEDQQPTSTRLASLRPPQAQSLL